MSDSASVDPGGGAVASGPSDHLERLRSLFETFNELVRTEGDVLTWEQEYFDSQAEYRPIEDRDWFGDPHAITRALVRWIEIWGVGRHRIKPEEILALGDERFLITAHNSGIGRRRSRKARTAGPSQAPSASSASTRRRRNPVRATRR